MLFGLFPIRIMILAYQSSKEFYLKCGIQRKLSVLWDTDENETRITNDTDYYCYYN